MNYNHDTDHDLEWAQDQLRRNKLSGTGLPDVPVRRVTASLVQRGDPMPIDPSVSRDMTLGNSLSALAIHAHNDQQCHRICDSILALLSDRDRLGLHAEFVELNGIHLVLGVVKNHGDEPALAALRILDKLSRTSARELSAAGGIDVVLERCDIDGQVPRVVESSLKILHGLTFDTDSKLLLLRRGVRGLAESIVEAKQGAGAGSDWQDVHTIATRLQARLGEGQKGYSNKWERGCARPLT